MRKFSRKLKKPNETLTRRLPGVNETLTRHLPDVYLKATENSRDVYESDIPIKGTTPIIINKKF